MNVFADDITIEDDMSVLVRYDNGANMTYHLTAYSVSLSSFTLYPFTSSASSHLLSTPSTTLLPLSDLSPYYSIMYSSRYISHLPVLYAPPSHQSSSFQALRNTHTPLKIVTELTAALGRIQGHVQRRPRPTRARSSRIIPPNSHCQRRRYHRSHPR